jgi:acyl-CoA synthetase (AMP-forming)/AMP-acid ligase II
MLDQLIASHVSDGGLAMVTAGESVSWSELAQRARTWGDQHRSLAGRRVGLCLQNSASSIAVLAALDRLRADAFLLSDDLPEADRLRMAEELRLAALVQPAADANAQPVLELFFSAEASSEGDGSVTILTSGSTGKPKAVRHTWASLARPVRLTPEYPAPRWLLTYRPNLYAGLQVLLQCFANGGTLVVPAARAEPKAVAELAAAASVQFASATPSYWRRLLLFADAAILSRIPLVQITLGGEAVPQTVLDALAERFPSARLVHIYATTELGRCFSVTDGLAGFPQWFLDQRSADGIELRIEDGELYVRSANASLPEGGPATAWQATGDLVELVEDRVHFRGRRSDLINVGGNKVHPLEVERVIRAVPSVLDVRVFGRASSVAGQLVACEIVPAPGLDPASVEDAVQAHCRVHLASHQRPRLIRMVEAIDLSPAGKQLRRAVP